MRGIMNFDDYNYKSFNDYVLVEEPKVLTGKKKPATINQYMIQQVNVELKEDLLEEAKPEALVHDSITLP